MSKQKDYNPPAFPGMLFGRGMTARTYIRTQILALNPGIKEDQLEKLVERVIQMDAQDKGVPVYTPEEAGFILPFIRPEFEKMEKRYKEQRDTPEWRDEDDAAFSAFRTMVEKLEQTLDS